MNATQKTALTLAAVGVGAWLVARSGLLGRRYDYRGKVVLITGGSRGLGLLMARRLTEQGARVAICARDEEELRRAADDLEGRGARPLALRCDVGDAEEVGRFVRAVETTLGPVDVLINNAGVIQVGPEACMTREDYEQALDVHLWGPFNTIEAVLPSMRARKQGRIVNISSIGGKVSVPHLLPYCTSKFALVGYSEGLRTELAPYGIHVTTVCPGLMRTGSPPNARFKGHNEAEYAWFAVSDSLPGLTIAGETAARQILEACRRGDAEVILSLPAQLAVRFHGVFPGLTAQVLSLVNRVLPGPGGIGTASRSGAESESFVTESPSPLTYLTRRAAERNNEMETASG